MFIRLLIPSFIVHVFVLYDELWTGSYKSLTWTVNIGKNKSEKRSKEMTYSGRLLKLEAQKNMII